MILTFDDVARLPIPDDNVAIATQTLRAGAKIRHADALITLSHTVLVGHRFAVREIALGDPLLSWGQTFGVATKAIQAGDYVLNADVLKELGRRNLDFPLPDEANFQNDLETYHFDEQAFSPATALPHYEENKTFMGYPRLSVRGVGTRNTIVLLGVSSLVSGFVRKLENHLKHLPKQYPNIDAIVAVAHTEGGHGQSNNQDLLLRTLAGFIVHPNVGAVLIVDYAYETINNHLLQNYLADYPLDSVLHHFMSLSDSFTGDMHRAEAIVMDWLAPVNAMERSPQSLRHLKIALQCGGSDALSGISGNPLAAWVAKEVIQYGGSANLAETDELIGAEHYVLDKVRDKATAKKFLSFVDRFKERVSWHGHSAEGNPSGGNKYRGLYNIYLKSLGAASKRHPDVPLDYVIDYSERMLDAGYYFMDSPGNDLESIAGQVAAGCNMIFFVTGNGSITNFPFVPTIKIVTTTERYHLLQDDMDINAGSYLDGTLIEQVGRETLNYTLEIASGTLSVGEEAGHSQVQIWRDWQLTQAVDLTPLQNIQFEGKPIPITRNMPVLDLQLEKLQYADTLSSRQLGLILPTSLCSGQIAKMCVEALNKHPMLAQSAISQFVTFTHTEGCGGSINPEFNDTLLGYLGHPFVTHALLLEHGCEATHNAYFRQSMLARGFQPDDYGWASIQLDGGIQRVIQKMLTWFETQIAREHPTQTISTSFGSLRLAIIAEGNLRHSASLTTLIQMIVGAGGTVLLSEHDSLLEQSVFTESLGIKDTIYPTLGYAQAIGDDGLHIMAMPTRDWSEILTGLGASGAELIVSLSDKPKSGHPMIPVLHLSEQHHDYADMVLADNALDALLDLIKETVSRRYTPKAMITGNVNFQVTRGLLGVSL